MTNKIAYAQPKPQIQKKTHARNRRLVFCYMSLFIMILFFKNADAAAVWVTEGLALCAGKLIPSLFPFMAVSSLIVASGLGNAAACVFGKPFRALFGIGGEGSVAVILGWACGFPVGAKCACELYASSRISHAEYSRLLCICGTPSPAFLIATVGGTMLGSRTSGLGLYLISIASALILGIILKLIAPIPQSNREPPVTNTAQSSLPLAKVFTRAVSEAAVGMLNVCAFVVFFSAFLGTLESALSFVTVPRSVHALLFAFFELTSGLSAISSISFISSNLTLPLCALAVGWSGISVHFQTIAICSAPVSFKPYFLSHTARAIICFLLGMLIL
ncbi:MAG: hypothetical protein IJY08_01365 [Clostridia bacterium]|nr:hypothetical protein [Clostridia bacterium]